LSTVGKGPARTAQFELIEDKCGNRFATEVWTEACEFQDAIEESEASGVAGGAKRQLGREAAAESGAEVAEQDRLNQADDGRRDEPRPTARSGASATKVPA
jgi:hypothetical protein